MPAKKQTAKKWPKRTPGTHEGIPGEVIDYGMETAFRFDTDSAAGALLAGKLAVGSVPDGEAFLSWIHDYFAKILSTAPKDSDKEQDQWEDLCSTVMRGLSSAFFARKALHDGNLPEAIGRSILAGIYFERHEQRRKLEALVRSELGRRDGPSGRKKEDATVFLEDLAKRKPGLSLSEVERHLRDKGLSVGDTRRAWNRARRKK